ncbi:MAG: glycosyltransferase family 4 protein [Balneolales bacterium]|nr:glycosyltransferase family 4 protein [Balneolales bacterium]
MTNSGSTSTHILMMVHSYYLRDHRVRREAESLISWGYKVSCIYVEPDKNITHASLFNGVHLIPLHASYPAGKKRFVDVILKMGRIAKKIPFDVLHAHDLDALTAARFFSGSLKKKLLIYDSHELYLNSVSLQHRKITKTFWAIAEYLAIQRANRVITVCESIASILQDRYKLKLKPDVIRNFSEKFISVTAKSDFMKIALEIKERVSAMVLYHGVIREGRGLDLLFDMLAADSSTGAIICGDGPMLEALKQRSENENIANRILFTGFIDRSGFYCLSAIADIGYCYIEPTNPSYYYSLPNKLTEYIQAGLPVLASNLPEISKILHTYGAGITIPEKHIHHTDLSKAIHEIVKGKDNMSNNLKKAQDLLNWDNEQLRLKKLYHELFNTLN